MLFFTVNFCDVKIRHKSENPYVRPPPKSSCRSAIHNSAGNGLVREKQSSRIVCCLRQQILAKCFLLNLYEHSISFLGKKAVYFGILKIELCCIIWNINTKAAGIVYEQNALVCSLFNQVCQLFSINIASVFILVTFNTVYDSFSRWKAFFDLSYFFALL